MVVANAVWYMHNTIIATINVDNVSHVASIEVSCI